jgi:hypothetical protein
MKFNELVEALLNEENLSSSSQKYKRHMVVSDFIKPLSFKGELIDPRLEGKFEGDFPHDKKKIVKEFQKRYKIVGDTLKKYGYIMVQHEDNVFMVQLRFNPKLYGPGKIGIEWFMDAEEYQQEYGK